MERSFLHSKLFLGLLFLSSILSSCTKPSEGEFLQLSQSAGQNKIMVATGNGTANSVSSYSESGEFLELNLNTSDAGLLMRGISPFDALHVLLAFDGQDGLSTLSLVDGTVTSFVASSLFAGNIYQVVKDEVNSRFYAIESNAIEAFGLDGSRLGNPYITTTVGGCVLSAPRGLTMTASGYLAVASYSNNDINVYDVSGATPTCVNSYTGYGNDRPIAILGHSDGFLYIGFQTNDRIDKLADDGSGSPTTVLDDLLYINNPTSMLEMPDGTLLVASDGVDSIVHIDTSGELVDGGIFIKDPFTGLVTQMVYVEGQ